MFQVTRATTSTVSSGAYEVDLNRLPHARLLRPGNISSAQYLLPTNMHGFNLAISFLAAATTVSAAPRVAVQVYDNKNYGGTTETYPQTGNFQIGFTANR